MAFSLPQGLRGVARGRGDLLALGATLILAPQLIGGAHPWAIVVTCALALGALALSPPARQRLPRAVGWLVWAMAAALAWTALQAAPLPAAVVAALAPDSLERLATAHALVGLPEPAWGTLSRDPGRTREEVLKGVAIVAVFLVALRAGQRDQARSVFRLLAAATLALLLTTVAHAAVGAQKVFGVYEPIQVVRPDFLSPILNMNSLGGVLAVGAILCAGLALDVRALPWRLALLGGALALAGGVFATRSRGAVGAMLFGFVVFALLWRFRTRRRRRGSGRRRDPRADRRERLQLVAGVALMLLLGGVAVTSYVDAMRAEFTQGGWDKVELIAHAFGFALEQPLLGVGRGAFSSAFAAHLSGHNRFEYAENLVAQWMAEWGLPVALALLVTAGWALWDALRRRSSAPRLGALAALLALTLQNLVDLGLELLGVAVIAAALFGAALGRPVRHSAPASAAQQRLPRGLRWGLLGAGACALLALGPTLPGSSPYALEASARAALADKDFERLDGLLRRAMRLHPHEPVFAVIGASAALLRDPKSAGAWINHAMLLAPAWTAPHVQAVQWLWNSGRRSQALIELELVASRSPRAAFGVLCPIARIDFAGAAAAAPDGANRPEYLELLAQCVPLDSPDAEALDAELRKAYPRRPAAYIRHAQRLTQQNRWQEAVEVLRAVQALQPNDGLVAQRLAWALFRAEEFEAALRVIEGALPRGERREGLLQVKARCHARLGQEQAMRDTLSQLRGEATSDQDALARAWAVEGGLEEQLGNGGAALAAYERAWSISNEPGHLLQGARLAERLERRMWAYRAYLRLCQLGPGQEHACQQLDRLGPATGLRK